MNNPFEPRPMPMTPIRLFRAASYSLPKGIPHVPSCWKDGERSLPGYPPSSTTEKPMLMLGPARIDFPVFSAAASLKRLALCVSCVSIASAQLFLAKDFLEKQKPGVKGDVHD
jgi:hypothetical protein